MSSCWGWRQGRGRALGGGAPALFKAGPDRLESSRGGASDGAARIGADRSGPERTGADRSGPERTGADRSGPERTGADRRGPARPGAARAGSNAFAGGIAAVRVDERALSAGEVAAQAPSKPDAAADKTRPAREWPPGKPAGDGVGDGIHHPVAGAHGAAPAGMLGGLAWAEFGGGFLEVKAEPELVAGGDFTVEAWVHPAVPGMTARNRGSKSPGSDQRGGGC
jgi:hypothetical protein